MPLSAGDKLGPYEILARIGAGGMGEVWKARDTRLSRIVAVKRLKDNHSARFEQEARAIAALNHPHICQIHDIGPDYLVLEYIEGQPLQGPLAVEEAVRVAAQIAEALDSAHRKGVLHRDLKPANIMVTSEGSVKLLDFGLAKQVSDAEATATMEGMAMGTAAYMAPEQVEGRPLDARSDVFSFGVVLYELLSGRRAFPRGELRFHDGGDYASGARAAGCARGAQTDRAAVSGEGAGAALSVDGGNKSGARVDPRRARRGAALHCGPALRQHEPRRR
jgi:eukaryotic-like serine/threonine-protein kinase